MAEPSETTQVTGGPSGVEADELLGAVRALSEQVGELRSELKELRAQASSLPADDAELHGWQDGSRPFADDLAWVRSLGHPALRRPAVPRLPLEIAFLVAVAVLAAVAELDAPVIALVVAAAWALVAALEWASAAAARRRAEAVSRSGVLMGPVAEDASWFEPPLEEPELELVEGGESTRAKLPPPQE